MKIYAICEHNREPGLGGYRGTWPYREFFHGQSQTPANRYRHETYVSLQLIRNRQILPPVFFPGIAMVVNDAIAKSLGEFSSIDLVPCAWRGVYDYPVDENHVRKMLARFSILSDDFTDWIDSELKPVDDALALPAYSEVVAPQLRDVVKDVTCRHTFSLPSPMYMHISPICTDVSLHMRYPVLTLTPYYLVTDPVYQILDQHLDDPHMFRIYPHEVK